jgi:hypothetical protein
MEVWRAGFPDEAEALPLASAEVMGLQAQDSAVGFQVMGLQAQDSAVGLQVMGLQAQDSAVGFQVMGLQAQDSAVGFQVARLRGRDSGVSFIKVSFITVSFITGFAITISSSFPPDSGFMTGGTRGTGTIPITIRTITRTRIITPTTTRMTMRTTGSMDPLRTVTGLLPGVWILRYNSPSRDAAIIRDQLMG